MRNLIVLLPAVAALLLFSCDDAPTVVNSGDRIFYSDQGYYPTEENTFWRYRIDTTGVSGLTMRDVIRRTSRIFGRINIDSLEYTLQINENVGGVNTTYDTLYIRKTESGVYLSSPQLQTFSRFGSFLGDFPKEVLLIPASLSSASTWNIINYQFDQIPFFPIYFRVSASFLNKESIQLDLTTFKECIKIRVDIDARLPNLQNPQDFLNPTIIKESANFWLSRPLGLVAGDGSEVVFVLLQGRIPLALVKRRMHQELIGFDIIQPKSECPGGPR